MSNRWKVLLAAIALALSTGTAGCTGLASTSAPTMCDGIDAEIGGCDPDRPSYVGTGCDAVAIEAGRQLDRRLAAIYAGPDNVNELSKSVRSLNATTLVLGLANQHLRANGDVIRCPAESFVATMTTEFSEDVKRQAGTYIYDGQPVVSYDEFLADLRQIASVVEVR